MFFLIAFLFLVVPIVELYVLVQVAQGIGTLQAIGLMIVISILGAWLVRAEGFAVMNRVRQQLAQLQVPGKEVVDGALILFAGALLLTPGFVTDGVGLFCLFPPTRAIARTAIMRRYKDRIQVSTQPGFGPGGFGAGFGTPGQPGRPGGQRPGGRPASPDDIIDVSGTDISDPPADGPDLTIRPQDTIDE